ncbi:MAG: CvpA family protein [Clostridia bacterium]
MILDVVLIVLLALGALCGYKKGLVGILISFICLVASIFLAFALQSSVANFLNDTTLGKTINNSITSSLEKNINEGQLNASKNSEVYNKVIQSVINGEKIEDASKSLTLFILKGISFIGIFIIVFIVGSILKLVLNLVFDLPLLNSVNKFGGMGLGILSSLVKIWLIFTLLTFLSPMPFMKTVNETIKNTKITNAIYNNNIFINILSSNFKK